MYKIYRKCQLCERKIQLKYPNFSRRNCSKTVGKVPTTELDPGYVPHKVESLDLGNGYFEPPIRSKKPFSLVLPPPNITGTLHLGHALTATVEDVLIRWKKMQGVDTMWIPGIDHAGIATQVMVEKRLWKESHQTRHDIGRRLFQEKIWEWKAEKAKVIGQQLRRLGVSLDWEREVFTMDQSRSKAVHEAFIKLFELGLIYRGDHLVNWSCVLQSAISDIEVEHISLDGPTNVTVPGYEKPVKFGTLTKFAYQIKDTDEEIVVATTRPETILGDVAVAVHPEDDRYSSFVGRYLWHPFRHEAIPVISDTIVDPGFGTEMDAINELTSHHSLRCSVCKNFLNVAPVLTSEDGKINKCGRCSLKGPPLNNRNSLYETIGAKLSFPCINEECKERLAWSDVERHEKSCKYRKITCPFWVCREKGFVMNISNGISHFETEHPGTVHSGVLSLNLTNMRQLQSFMKLLMVKNQPYLIIAHIVGTGDRIWIGVFNFDDKFYDYQIKVYVDKLFKKCIIYREGVALYDESKHCLYCLQNLCTRDTHKYSKLYPENQKQKFGDYTKIDVLCAKNVLLSDTMSFDISIVPAGINLNGK